MTDARPRPAPLSRAIAGAAAVLVVILWALFAWHAHASRGAVLERARDVAAGLSRALREHAVQSFSTIDTALGSLDSRPELDDIAPRPDNVANHQIMRRLRDSIPILAGIALLDARGRVIVNAESPNPVATDLSDRPYFIRQRDEPDAGLLIGDPVLSRPGDVWVIPVSRRFVDEKGSFAGIVAARLPTSYFNQVYRAIGVGTVTLLRDDGTILTQERDGKLVRDTPLPAGLIAQVRARATGLLDASTAGDGTAYTYGYSSSRTRPLTVVVGIDRSAALGVWWRDTLLLAAAALLMTGAVLGFAALLLTRVAAQWRMTIALEAAREAEHAAKLQAEEANRARAEFLAHTSHEIRTPLNAINGFAEIMTLELFGPVENVHYRDYAGLILHSGQHLLSIVNNILDLSKVDAGQWRVTVEAVDIAQLFATIETMTHERAAKGGVTVGFTVAPLPGSLRTDRRLLLQILLNLTTNAIKFTPAGGRVTVSAGSGGDAIRFVVADTGDGMSPGDLASIFRPYASGSSLLGRLRHETGLGLTLSRRFAMLLGGSLSLDSTPGAGTTATVMLPLAAAPADG